MASIAPRQRHRNESARHRVASWSQPIELRLAAGSDLPELERLAQLDTRPLPPGPHLVAERLGRIEAALSLSTQEQIADPFSRTAELRELLRCLARQLPPAGDARRSKLRPRPRLVPA